MGGKAVPVTVSVEDGEGGPQFSLSHHVSTPVPVVPSSSFSVFLAGGDSRVHQGVKSVIKLSLKHHHHQRRISYSLDPPHFSSSGISKHNQSLLKQQCFQPTEKHPLAYPFFPLLNQRRFFICPGTINNMTKNILAMNL